MAFMPRVQKQNSCQSKGRHRIEEFSVILSKCKQETLINVTQLKSSVIKEPDRLDTEPITVPNGLLAAKQIAKP